MSSEKGKEQNSVTNSAAQTLVFKNCGPAYNGSITIYQTLCNKHQECRNKTHMMETESTEEKTGKPLNTVDRTAANEMTSPEILNSPAEVVTNGKDDGTKANEATVAVDKKDSTRKTIEEELKSRIMDALKTIETLREELEMDQFQQPTGFENNSIDLVICCEMEVKTLEKLYQSKMDEQKSMFEDMNELKRRLDSNVLIQIETKKLITKSLKYKLMRMKQQMEKMLVKRQSNLKNIQKNLMKWMNLDLTVKNHIEKDADLMKFVSGNLESDDFIFSKKIEKSLISSHEMMKSLKDGGFERPSSISSTRPGALVSPMDFVIPPRIDFDSNSPNSMYLPNELSPLQSHLQSPDAVPTATDSVNQISEQMKSQSPELLVPEKSKNVEDESKGVRNTRRRRNIAPIMNVNTKTARSMVTNDDIQIIDTPGYEIASSKERIQPTSEDQTTEKGAEKKISNQSKKSKKEMKTVDGDKNAEKERTIEADLEMAYTTEQKEGEVDEGSVAIETSGSEQELSYRMIPEELLFYNINIVSPHKTTNGRITAYSFAENFNYEKIVRRMNLQLPFTQNSHMVFFFVSNQKQKRSVLKVCDVKKWFYYFDAERMIQQKDFLWPYISVENVLKLMLLATKSMIDRNFIDQSQPWTSVLNHLDKMKEAYRCSSTKAKINSILNTDGVQMLEALLEEDSEAKGDECEM